MKKTALWICGVLSFPNAIFHLAFWKLFGWNEELPKLSPENQGIFQVLNIMVVYILLFMGATTWRMCRQLNWERGERTLLCFYGGFFLLRALLQWPFFGFSAAGMALTALCLIIAGIYLWNGLVNTANKSRIKKALCA